MTLIKVYDANTQECLLMKSKGTDADLTSPSLGLAAGTYYVRVASAYKDNSYESWSNVYYQFTVKYEQSAYWEAEKNEEYATATPIAVNAGYNGANLYNNDIDYYKIDLPSAGAVSIDFSHINLLDAKNYWTVKVYDTTTTECLKIVSQGTETNKTSASLGLAAGTYYIRIAPAYKDNSYEGWSDTTYQFKVNYTASPYWESEKNDTYPTADPIVKDTVYYGALQYSNDIDCYALTTSEDGYICIDFQHPQLTEEKKCWIIRLIDSSTNELMKVSNIGTAPRFVSDIYYLTAGTYFLKVNSAYKENSYDKYSDATYSLAVPTVYSYNIIYDLDGGTNSVNNPYSAFSNEEITLASPSREGCYKFLGWYLDETFQIPIEKIPYGNKEDVYLYAKWSSYHNYEEKLTRATLTTDGKIASTCTICGAEEEGSVTVIRHPQKIALIATSYVHDGKAKRPGVTVTDTAGEAISSDHYSVAYSSGRVGVGQYKVTVTFRGNYTGKKVLNFTIKPSGVKISSLKSASRGFTVKWGKKNFTGYQVQYSTSKDFDNPSTKIETLKKNKVTSLKVKKLKPNKKYYVRVRTYKVVAGKKYYSEWSKVKSVKTRR